MHDFLLTFVTHCIIKTKQLLLKTYLKIVSLGLTIFSFVSMVVFTCNEKQNKFLLQTF